MNEGQRSTEYFDGLPVCKSLGRTQRLYVVLFRLDYAFVFDCSKHRTKYDRWTDELCLQGYSSTRHYGRKSNDFHDSILFILRVLANE
jgi:hypothetical protein